MRQCAAFANEEIYNYNVAYYHIRSKQDSLRWALERKLSVILKKNSKKLPPKKKFKKRFPHKKNQKNPPQKILKKIPPKILLKKLPP